MTEFESEYRLLKVLELFTREEKDHNILVERIRYELKKYEKLYILSRLLENAEKGILDKQNQRDIEFLKNNKHITDNQYSYFCTIKQIAKQGYKQVEVATDIGFKYPSIQEQFEKQIKLCID